MRSARVSNTAANCRDGTYAGRGEAGGKPLNAEDRSGRDTRKRDGSDPLDRVKVGRVEVVERIDRVVDGLDRHESPQCRLEHLAEEAFRGLARLPDLAHLDSVWGLGGEMDDLADRWCHLPLQALQHPVVRGRGHAKRHEHRDCHSVLLSTVATAAAAWIHNTVPPEPGTTGRLAGDQCARKVVRVERAQVVEALADAHELDRQPELVGDRDGDTAARRAVELRQRDARDACGVAEETRLPQAVLSRWRVDDEQGLDGCAL